MLALRDHGTWSNSLVGIGMGVWAAISGLADVAIRRLQKSRRYMDYWDFHNS
jgi:hypothetical protein